MTHYMNERNFFLILEGPIFHRTMIMRGRVTIFVANSWMIQMMKGRYELVRVWMKKLRGKCRKIMLHEISSHVTVVRFVTCTKLSPFFLDSTLVQPCKIV